MLRILVGILVGLGYGAFVGAVMFLIYCLSSDPPVDLIPDPKAVFWFLILLAMTITGSSGVVVGFMATFLRLGKIKAGIMGFGVGLVVLAGVFFQIRPQLKIELADITWPSFGIVFLFMLVLMMMFPMGLAATGVTASVLARRGVSTNNARAK